MYRRVCATMKLTYLHASKYIEINTHNYICNKCYLGALAILSGAKK